MKTTCQILLVVLFFVFGNNSFAQKNKNTNLVYVDSKGVMRYTKNKVEATFFGVNYTVPFAYGYRSHLSLNVDPEKAIDADVYHMSRLGFNAFRVHVWDVEISDSLGNLLENEHLRLFDYLIKKLKEKQIKILITPIAFWGNGYPEKDVKTNGFSSVYGKRNAVVLDAAIKAQENYLQQFFRHINPYTKLAYKDDPDVIAMEINNEPQHSGTKNKVTAYINRLTTAVKSTGWNKPVFYNISESPTYADAIVKANVDGHSFQWYPTGLVAGHEQKGNYLPHVDRYTIPFNDTIPAFINRAKMVYEFDAADIMQSNMYPAMARSFRTAGFQWATQFAYDPMATAYANTEYQTHYLNLVYTPSKAISLMIAAKAFHSVPRYKTYSSFPSDTLFEVFRVSYKNNLSEMNSDEEFYYSNPTTTTPKNINALKNIAGVGTSAVVQYEGLGAYFIDKIEEGAWRLEIMPDALFIHDAFEKASLKKEVTRVFWQENLMKLNLPGISHGCRVIPVNEGNNFQPVMTDSGFFVRPGVYLLLAAGKPVAKTIISKEYYAPVSVPMEPVLVHQPLKEVTADKDFFIHAVVAGIGPSGHVSIELRNSHNQWKTLAFKRNGNEYSVAVPADFVKPGLINYRIFVKKENEIYTFPGGYIGDPYKWDHFQTDNWEVIVSNTETPVVLFDAVTDRNKVVILNPDWRKHSIEYTTTDQPKELAIRAMANQPVAGRSMGFQFYFGDKIKGRSGDLSMFSKLAMKARSVNNQPVKMKLTLITKDAQSFAVDVNLDSTFSEHEIAIKDLQPSSFLLLPRPYPGFLPLNFAYQLNKLFQIDTIEKLEISFEEQTSNKHLGIEVSAVWLKK